MRTLTSGWSESRGDFQHDEYRSRNEGDFSPTRGTHGPLLTHAWLHILLKTSTIYHLHAVSSYRIHSTSIFYTADTCKKAKHNHWRLKSSNDFISSMCWDFMGLFLISIFIIQLQIKMLKVLVENKTETLLQLVTDQNDLKKDEKSYIFCIIVNLNYHPWIHVSIAQKMVE